MLILIELNQEVVSRNWKCVDVVSKKNNKVTHTLRINKDQKSEKLRIKLISVLLVKTRTKQANKGREIIVDNSIKKSKKGKLLLEQLITCLKKRFLQGVFGLKLNRKKQKITDLRKIKFKNFGLFS